MSHDGDKKAFPAGPILGDDTPSEWDDDDAPAEGLTEFEFSPPSLKRRPSSSADLSRASNVEALLDRVIDEIAPPKDAVDTAEMDKQPRPGKPTTKEDLPATAPVAPIEDTQPPPLSMPAPTPLAAPLPAAPPFGTPPASAPPTPPPPSTPKDEPFGASLAELSFAPASPESFPAFAPPKPAVDLALPPQVAEALDPVAPPPPTDIPPDGQATAEMRKPPLGERPEAKRPRPTEPPPPPADAVQIPAAAEVDSARTPIPVGRDVGTEMFDGQAAAIDHMVQVSLGERNASSVRVPEELSDEVKAVSKVLMGRTDGEETPHPNFDPRSLTDDLALDASARAAGRPPPTAPPSDFGAIPPPMPTSSPSGGELDAVADAFTMETSDPSGESILELAYDPKSRTKTPTPPARRNAAFLDDVTPSGMTSGTKIFIAAAVVLLVIGIAVIFR